MTAVAAQLAASSSSSSRADACSSEWVLWTESCSEIDDDEHVQDALKSTWQSPSHFVVTAPSRLAAVIAAAGRRVPECLRSLLARHLAPISRQIRSETAAGELGSVDCHQTTGWWLCALSNASSSSFTTCLEGKLIGATTVRLRMVYLRRQWK